tara:strand:- start:2551 stop:2973 length:423 start_codon:yes stop_codon:yes gene_type:complete
MVSWYPWPEWPKDKEGGYTGEPETECSTCGKRERRYTSFTETDVPGPGLEYPGLLNDFGDIGIFSWKKIYSESDRRGYNRQVVGQVCSKCKETAHASREVAIARHRDDYQKKQRKSRGLEKIKKRKHHTDYWEARFGGTK